MKERIVTLLLTICMMFSLVSCGEKTQPADGGESTDINTEDSGIDNSDDGKSEAVVEAEDYDPNELITVMQSVGISLEMFDLFYTRVEDDKLYYPVNGNIAVVSLPDGQESVLELNWPEKFQDATMNQHTIGEDGSIYCVTTVWEERDPNKEYYTSTPYLCKFDSEGQFVFAENIEQRVHEIGDEAPSWSSKWMLEVDSQGRIYLSHEKKIFFYNGDGSYHGVVRMLEDDENPDIRGLNRMQDGSISVYAGCGWGGRGYIARIDFENKQLLNETEMLSGYRIAFDDEEVLKIVQQDGFFAYDFETEERTLLLNWADYNLNPQDIMQMAVLPDGSVFIIVLSFETGYVDELCFTEMTRAQAKELQNGKETINFAVFGDQGSIFNQAVAEFNKENKKYIIAVENYVDDSLENAERVGLDRLNSEIAAGKGPDLIDAQYLDLESLAEKGVFENLYDYLDNSRTLSKEDFLDNLLAAYTIDDKLPVIPSAFTLETLVGNSNLVGEEMGWTLEELLSMANEHQHTELFNRMTRAEVLETFLIFNESLFLDEEKGQSNFNSQLFRDMLKVVRRFDEKIAPSDITTSIFARIQNEEVLLARLRCNRLNAIQPYRAAFDEKMTCIGYPTPEGNGCLGTAYGLYGISAQSKQKEGAWEFLEYYLQLENTDNVGRFSGLKRNLDLQIEDYRKNGDNTVSNYPDGWSYEYHTPTEEEIAEIYDLIEAAQFRTLNAEILSIISEEAESYFAGQKPVDVVTEIIQNRVQNYMEERKQKGRD